MIEEMPDGKKRYSVGTLSYTLPGLIVLFSWLLWGDFMWRLFEIVEPKLLPLLLKSHGATNSQISVIVNSVAMALNAICNPIISFRSDRTRTRWGRRRPYIMFTTPLVALFVAATPFTPRIFDFVTQWPFVQMLFSHSSVPGIIVMFGIIVAGYQTFNMFVCSVYYYLIPDVVPPELIGRFGAMFRLAGTIASMIFNFFIFVSAQKYMTEFFVVIAVLYCVVMLIMCWRVKEGQYPPVPPKVGKNRLEGVWTYLTECFGSGRFWLLS